MSIDLRALQYVVAVADEGGFQSAADRLGMAQPPLSRKIADLEKDLGVRLFERRPTRLTEAGEVFVEAAKSILADLERLHDRMVQTGLGAFGTVRIGYVASVAYDTLPRLLKAVEARYPGIRVEAQEAWSPILAEMLRDGRLDVALSHSVPLRPGLASWPVRSEELLAVVGKDHPLADRGAVHLRELVGGTLSFLPRRLAPTLYDVVVAALEETGEAFTIWENPLPGLRHHGFRSPLDFSVVPGSAARHIAETVPLTVLGDGLPRIELSLVWRPEALLPSASLLIEAAGKLAAAEGWVPCPTPTAQPT